VGTATAMGFTAATLATLLLLGALGAALGALALTERALAMLALGVASGGATTAALLFLSISEHFLESLSEVRHFYIIMRDIFYAK